MQPGFPPLLSDRWESRSVTLVVSLSSTNTTQQTRYPQSQGQLRLRSQLSPPKLRHLVARYPLAFCRVENGRLRRSLECRPNTNHTVPLLEFKPLSHTRRFPAESYILTLSDLLKHAVYTVYSLARGFGIPTARRIFFDGCHLALSETSGDAKNILFCFFSWIRAPDFLLAGTTVYKLDHPRCVHVSPHSAMTFTCSSIYRNYIN